MIEKRGGTDGLKEDAGELRGVAGGQGSLADKAQAAAVALKEPGAGAEPVADSTAPGVTAGEKQDGRGMRDGSKSRGDGRERGRGGETGRGGGAREARGGGGRAGRGRG